MPINAFGGGPGSGKTYGVMEHVILPAIAEGRFILTNIEGLNAQAIYDYTVTSVRLRIE
jgi:zona occludens toxin